MPARLIFPDTHKLILKFTWKVTGLRASFSGLFWGCTWWCPGAPAGEIQECSVCMWGGASHQMRGAVWPFEPPPRLHITGFQKPQYSCGTQIVAKGQIIRSTQENGESRNRNTEICPNSFFKVFFFFKRGLHLAVPRGFWVWAWGSPPVELQGWDIGFLHAKQVLSP